MKSSRLLVSGLALAGLLQVPQSARAADTTKDQLVNLNRDLIEFEQKVKDRQDAQDAKLDKLIDLLQKTQETTAKNNADLASNLANLQRTLSETVSGLSTSLNDQQTKLARPTAELGSKVDALTQEMNTMGTSLESISRRISEQNNKLAEISGKISQIATPPPPPPGAASVPTAPAQPTAEQLWTDATRDIGSGQQKLAMDELSKLVMLYPTNNDYAPKAYFNMGLLYDQNMQYKDAIGAYNASIDNYPEGQWTRDSMYNKGVILKKLYEEGPAAEKATRKAEAIQVLQDFQVRFRGDERQPNVSSMLSKLKASAPSSGSKSKQARH